MQAQNISGTVSARPGRSPLKTFVGAFLLALIPIVGWSMATVYILTRREPDQYNAGRAAEAGIILAGFLIVGWLVVWFVVRVIAVSVAQMS